MLSDREIRIDSGWLDLLCLAVYQVVTTNRTSPPRSTKVKVVKPREARV